MEKSALSQQIHFDFGTFEGFNFRSQSAIHRNVTASEVIEWDHDQNGEAEFWPAGDRAEVAMLFHHQTAVTGAELRELDRLLGELGGDSPHHFIQIHYAVNICGAELASLSSEDIEDQCIHLFFGSNFLDLYREAAYELFQLYYPDEYSVWEKSTCDGLIFDTDRFLGSPSFFVEEMRLGDQTALLVAPR